MRRIVSLRFLLSMATCASAFELSGTVSDRLGVVKQGVAFSIAGTGQEARSDASGRWVLSTAGVQRRPELGLSLRWSDRGVQLQLERPAMVGAEWFDSRGALLGRRAATRLEVGTHVLADGAARGGVAWAKVFVDGRPLLVGGVGSGRTAGERSASPARSLASSDSLVVSMGSRILATLPVAGFPSTSGISLKLDFDSTFPWAAVQDRYGWLRDVRDGKIYRTVRIGTSNWMAENLDHSGSTSAIGICPSSSGSAVGGAPDSCARYGRLYTWAEALAGANGSSTSRIQGVCPAGWHLPTTTEWRALATAEGMAYSTLGWDLRATSGWTTEPGRDAKGFRALAGGFRNPEGNFLSKERMAYWWTTTPYVVQGATVADAFGVDERRGFVDQLLATYAVGVRCLAD